MEGKWLNSDINKDEGNFDYVYEHKQHRLGKDIVDEYSCIVSRKNGGIKTSFLSCVFSLLHQPTQEKSELYLKCRAGYITELPYAIF